MSDIPKARVVKIGPAPERLDDADTGEHRPITAFDVSDENPAVIANHLRALQREVHAGFEMVTQKLLTAIERINTKLDDFRDWKDEVTRWQEATDKRLAALEKKRKARK